MNHVYEIATGRLVTSTARPVDESLLPPYQGLVTSDKKGIWNPETLDFDPVPVNKVKTKQQFLDLFTDTELENIIGISRTNNRIAVFIKKIEMRDNVDLDDPQIIAAVNGMETRGLLVTGRAAEILA